MSGNAGLQTFVSETIQVEPDGSKFVHRYATPWGDAEIELTSDAPFLLVTAGGLPVWNGAIGQGGETRLTALPPSLPAGSVVAISVGFADFGHPTQVQYFGTFQDTDPNTFGATSNGFLFTNLTDDPVAQTATTILPPETRGSFTVRSSNAQIGDGGGFTFNVASIGQDSFIATSNLAICVPDEPMPSAFEYACRSMPPLTIDQIPTPFK